VFAGKAYGVVQQRWAAKGWVNARAALLAREECNCLAGHERLANAQAIHGKQGDQAGKEHVVQGWPEGLAQHAALAAKSADGGSQPAQVHAVQKERRQYHGDEDAARQVQRHKIGPNAPLAKNIRGQQYYGIKLAADLWKDPTDPSKAPTSTYGSQARRALMGLLVRVSSFSSIPPCYSLAGAKSQLCLGGVKVPPGSVNLSLCDFGLSGFD
jgi:hypothetical protein